MGTELPGKSLYMTLWQDIADSQTDWYVGIYGQMTWVTLLSILDPISHLQEMKYTSRLYTYSTNRKKKKLWLKVREGVTALQGTVYKEEMCGAERTQWKLKKISIHKTDIWS